MNAECSNAWLTKQRRIGLNLLAICIVVAFFNLPLRSSPESISLYRFLIPFQALSLFAISFRLFCHWMLSVGFIFVAGFIGCLVSGYAFRVDYNVVFFLHYMVLALFLFSAAALQKGWGWEGANKFIAFFWCVFFVVGLLELFAGLSLPNVEEKVGAIRGGMKNENDYTLMMSAASIYLIFYHEKRLFAWFSFFCSMMVASYNDSRVLEFALIFSLAGFLFFSGSSSKRIVPSVKLVFWGFFIFVSSLLLYFFLRYGGSNEISEILFDPILRIMTLTPYGLGYGSVSVRTDMSVFAIQDLLYTKGLGIGFGNSLAMIETARYGLVIEGAKSLHNFPLQIAAELGVFFFAVAAHLIFRNTRGKEKIVLGLLIFASLSQSIGIFSNYFFLLVLGMVATKKVLINKYGDA